MLCGRCQEPIEPGSSGVLMQHFSPSTPLPRVLLLPYHEECHLRGILGGVNHLRGKCTCCGGNQPPDPEGLTSREAAKMAVDFYRGRITDRIV